MMKFFRKHNKTLLAVFGVLLMVVFVGGTALQDMLTPTGNRTFALTNFGPITERDLRIANNVTEILQNLGFYWARPAIGAREDLETVDWILLHREAEQLKMDSSAAKVRATLPDPASIEQSARLLRIKSERIYHALAQLDAVQQAARVIGGAAAPSEASIRAAAARHLEKVDVNAVVLPATAFVDENQQFSDEQIQEHFDKYRERQAEGGIKFGYFLQPAINVEYIRIDRDAIASELQVPNLERRAREHFDERRQLDPAYKRLKPEDGPIAAPPDDDPASENFLTWEEAQETAKEQVRMAEADQVAAKIANWLISQAGQEWLDVVRDQTGYKPSPASVTEPGYYEKIVGMIPSRFAYPKAVSVHTTGFFSRDEALDVPELGEARYVPKGSYISSSLGDLAFLNQLLIPQVPDEKGVRPSDYLSAHQTCRYTLRDANANVFVFRVIDSREGQIPDSVELVRDKVIADLRLAAGYETALYRADSLQSCDDCENLEEAFNLDDELVEFGQTLEDSRIGYFDLAPFSRASQAQAAQGSFNERVYVGGGVRYLPPEAVETCFGLAGADAKMTTLTLEDEGTVVVVEWVETLPPMIEDFDRIRKSFVDQFTRLRTQDAVAAWLKPDNIRARNGFELAVN